MFSPQPVKTRRMFEVICEQIRDEIDDGKLRPGDKLPPERELAAKLGVSRLAVREAMRILEYAGIIGLQKGVNGGAFILQGRPESIMESIQDLLFLGGISLGSLTEARIAILEPVVRLACARATEEDFQAIDRNIDRTERAGAFTNPEERLKIAAEFYKLLSRASKNEVLEILIDSITSVVVKRIIKVHPAMYDGIVMRRREFAAHLRARDYPAAMASLVEHLEGVHNTLAHREAARKRSLPETSNPKQGR